MLLQWECGGLRKDRARSGRGSPHERVILASLTLLLGLGCGSPAGPRPALQGAEVQRSTVPKRITASIMGEPAALIARMNTGAVSIPGVDALEQLVNAGLAERAAGGKLQPQLAEAVPSIENGLWKLSPDGRMETTWKIRSDARWQDGMPVTGDDMVFTATVDRDPELPILRAVGYGSVESVEAPEERTVVVRWKQPYIEADTMFTRAFAFPLPRHALEAAYMRDKAGLLLLPYWNHEFVGSGPYRVREFAAGSHLVVVANDLYVFGRPKIDEIEVKFIPAMSTLMTNIIAGAIELTLGRGLTVEHALQVRDQWEGGKMQVLPAAWIMVYPQLIDPNPPIIGDARFRRALMHVLDRQQMVETLQAGLTSVAHVYLNPGEPEHKEVENSVVRYEYDPRKATQMVQDLGYTKGPDGIFRDSTNQRLAVEVRSGVVEVLAKATVVISDTWTRLGVSAEPVVVPPQRITDRPYMWTFPGFLTLRQPNNASSLSRLRIAQTPLAGNNYVGSNYGRYMNPEFDALIETYFVTIPYRERMDVLREIMHHISDQVTLMGLFYDADIMFLSNRLQEVTARQSELWNVHLWDVR